MRPKSGCARALLLTCLLACNALIELGEASLGDAIKRPFSSVASKVRRLRDRAVASKHARRRDRIEGRAAGPRVASARPAGSPNDTSSADFESGCFLARGPSFRRAPVVFFYSARSHGPQTLGCATQEVVKLELEPLDGDLSDAPQLNRTLIRAQLIDTRLFNAQGATYVLVHGFMASWNSGNWMCHIKDLVLNSTAANVLIVDWSGGAKPLLPVDYSAATSNTQYVGALLGELIRVLVELAGQRDASRYHMIGHSLGAHICGFAGYYVNTLGRITGLDPAGPCFGSGSQPDDEQLEASRSGFLAGGRRRLSPESAELVVALHTDTGLFGLRERCADYDVFVNGGSRQPNCAASSLNRRIEDLLSLNIADGVSLDLTCAHSYAHELLDSFIQFVAPEAHSEGSAVQVSQSAEAAPHSQRPSWQRCYPMAYECADWRSFKAGECGFCADNDSLCLFTGLSLFQHQAKKSTELVYKASLAQSDDDEHDDDDDDDNQYNDEDHEDHHEHAHKSDSNQRERLARGQHFMRSGSAPEVCLFQYQVVLATRRKDTEAPAAEAKYYFYLHLPLELSGRLLDAQAQRLHDRLVQLSHKVAPDSTAFQLLQSNYVESLSARGALPARADLEVDFYTALITFHQAPADACKDDPTNGASRKDRWQLCRPLDSINEARLWSSSEQKLNSVLWLGLNYMSAPNEELRNRNSYVMAPAEGEQAKAREELEQRHRANLDELEPEQSKSAGQLVDSLKNKADCFLSLFDASSQSEAKKNFKCGRSARELKFALNLSAKRLA